MVFNKYKAYVGAFYCAVFFTFSGFYALVMLISNTVGNQFSRFFTIPIRMVIILLLFSCLMLVGKRKNVRNPVFIAFIAFSLLYMLRVSLEILKGSMYHMDNLSFLLYFLGFAFIPFLILYLKEDLVLDQRLYRSAVIISGGIMSIICLLYYRDLIGTVGRISLAISRSENYISPLALSYCGALTMGVALAQLFTTKVSKNNKLFLLGVITLSCVPFFLGASRGSIFALIVPFSLIIIYQQNKVKSFHLFAGMLVAGFLLVLLSSYFGSNVIERFTNIGSDVESGSSSASRLDIWKVAINHFLNNPILGFGLESPETGNYPHNIIVEVLLTTGILGFIPFMYLLVKAFQNALFIFKYTPESAWIGVIFLQSLMQNMFSGAIYTSSWLWFSMAFLLAANYKRNYLIEKLRYKEAFESKSAVV